MRDGIDGVLTLWGELAWGKAHSFVDGEYLEGFGLFGVPYGGLALGEEGVAEAEGEDCECILRFGRGSGHSAW